MATGRASLILFVLLLGSCSGTPREATLVRVLDAANRHQEISEIVSDLPVGASPLLGAVVSHSAQSSDGRRANPRIIVELSDGSLATFLLEGDSVELGLLDRVASEPLPVKLSGADGARSDEKGELLGELHPFPRRSHRFTAREVLNRWENGRDTHGCTGCHVDVQTTKGPLGQVRLEVEGESFPALVSPTSFIETPDDILCVPRDLERLHHCRCEHARPEKGCGDFDSLGPEGCRRLEAVLRLAPRQHPRYGPTREVKCLN